MTNPAEKNVSSDHLRALAWINLIEGEAGKIRETDLYPKLSAWIEASAPQKILEIGCGQGICSDKISLAGRKYVGLDPSPTAIDRAKKLYLSSDRNFVVGNAEELPFAEQSFDSAFSVSVWHLLNDLKKPSEELNRVLEPGGSFFIVTANPNDYGPWTSLYAESQLDGKRFEGKLSLPDHSYLVDVLYLHTHAEILKTLSDAGLAVSHTEVFRNFLLIQGTKS